MQSQNIQFVQITPHDLSLMVAEQVRLAIEPIIKQQVQPRDEVRRFGRKETAQRLGITLTTLWSKTKAGDIESEVFGRRVLYSEKAIEAALQKRKYVAVGGAAR